MTLCVDWPLAHQVKGKKVKEPILEQRQRPPRAGQETPSVDKHHTHGLSVDVLHSLGAQEGLFWTVLTSACAHYTPH